jgi:hypothetical protein
MTKTHITTRLDTPTLDALNRIQAHLETQVPAGMSVTKSDAMAYAINIVDTKIQEETMTQHTISVDNGLTTTTPEAALAKHDMETIANYMDDEIRERVYREVDGDITEAEFIRRYLKYADLVIG